MTARILTILLALAAGSATAQTTVRLDPVVPIVGQPVTATVTFDVNPERVSVFIRTVGTTAYQELIASDQGDNLWEVAVPFDVPREGLEAYAEYVEQGETLTEPLQNPAESPYRVPSFSLAARPDAPVPARQYRMITVPLVLGDQGVPVTLGSDAPIDVFGDDFGVDGDPAQWRLLRWDPRALRYRDAIEDADQFDLIAPGRGYWIITAGGGTFDAEQGLSAGVTFDGNDPFPGPVSVPVRTGWNQIGNPFFFPIQWDDVEKPAGIEDPVGFNGSFTAAQSTLRPWEGYFVFNPGRDGVLRFRALPSSGGSEARTATLADRMRLRAGRDAGVLSVTATDGTSTDEVYLGLSDAPRRSDRPLDLHKPPAIDAGLRIAVRADGADWLGRFQPRDGATWTLDVAVPPGREVTLHLDTHGAWPAGMVLEDLDRDIRLAPTNGKVVLPAVAEASTRRLRLQTGMDDDARPVTGVGAPWPNPSAGPVTVPYTLSASGPVRLVVLDALGRQVRRIEAGDQDAGTHALTWDGLGTSGQRVAAGVYLLRLDAAGRTMTTRVTRLAR